MEVVVDARVELWREGRLDASRTRTLLRMRIRAMVGRAVSVWRCKETTGDMCLPPCPKNRALSMSTNHFGPVRCWVRRSSSSCIGMQSR